MNENFIASVKSSKEQAEGRKVGHFHSWNRLYLSMLTHWPI